MSPGTRRRGSLFKEDILSHSFALIPVLSRIRSPFRMIFAETLLYRCARKLTIT